MSTTTITRCDECGREKGEVNHWWQSWVSRDRDLQRLHVQRWQVGSVGSAYDPTLLDLCGIECLLKRVSKFCAEQAGTAGTAVAVAGVVQEDTSLPRVDKSVTTRRVIRKG